MAIRLYRAYSPGTRSRSSLFFDEITTNRPQKALTFGKKACSGRNNRGVITLGNRGGGHKRKYRIISFNRKESNSEVDVVTARVISIEYDPNRNVRIALLCYENGTKKYVLIKTFSRRRGRIKRYSLAIEDILKTSVIF